MLHAARSTEQTRWCKQRTFFLCERINLISVHPVKAYTGVWVWVWWPLVSEQCTRVRSYPPGGSGDQPSRHSVSLSSTASLRPAPWIPWPQVARRCVFSEESCQCHAVVSWRSESSGTCARPPTKMGSGLSGSLLNRRNDVRATTRAKCYCANALRRRVRFNRMNHNLSVLASG